MTDRVLHIAADHPAYAGHFPGEPMLPGAVLLDETLRVIELERALDLTQWRLSSAKFLHTIRPGEALTLEHAASASGTIHFTVRTGRHAALIGTLSLAPASAA